MGSVRLEHDLMCDADQTAHSRGRARSLHGRLGRADLSRFSRAEPGEGFIELYLHGEGD